MSTPSYKHLFGPVPSRRLGRSLGIDLTPMKTCTFNCIYCQLGRTDNLTVERREWVPTHEVLAEIDDWIKRDGQADVITLAGSGEPTLHSRFGDVLAHVSEHTNIPTVLLTNGSLLHLPEVRRDASRASIVKVTFSAPDEAQWQRIHRPSAGVRFEDILRGLEALRAIFKGEIWLEVMVMRGVNTSMESMQHLSELSARFGPDRIQINTPVRPAAEAEALPLEEDRLKPFAELFDPPAEIIGKYQGPTEKAGDVSTDAILALVSRHPATFDEIAANFSISSEDLSARLRHLTDSRKIREIRQGDASFYTSSE